jgi:inner membrane transporter RhtA
VGICSSVIPYVADQLVMARVPRATFSLLLSLLPAVATLVGALMLQQLLSLVELCGVVLVAAGIFLHRNRS